MAFDLSTAKPVSGFDLSTAQPVDKEKRLETALPAPVAEAAGAINRGVAAIPDFFIDAGNAALGLAGVEKKIPRVGDVLEDATGGTRNFMEPGLARTVIQEGGEWVPAIAQPFAAPERMAKGAKATKELLEEAAPSIDDLKRRASQVYQQIDDTGAEIIPNAVNRLALSAQKLKAEGLDPILTPKANRAAQRLGELAEEGRAPLKEIDTLRKIAGAAVADGDATERRVGRMLQQSIDDFLETLNPNEIVGADAQEIQKLYGVARGLTQRYKKGESIEQAIDLAREQASGFENGLRTQFRQLSRKIVKGQSRGWTPDEVAAIRRVGQGGKLENTFKLLGKFGVSDEQAVRVLMPSLGAAGGAAVGGPVGAFAVPAIGQAARTMASKMTQNNANLASALARAGRDGKKIADAYARSVPIGKRDPEHLAALLLANKVPIPAVKTLQKSSDTLTANAAFLTIIASEKLLDQVADAPNG